jgi:hypothetical protein
MCASGISGPWAGGRAGFSHVSLKMALEYTTSVQLKMSTRVENSTKRNTKTTKAVFLRGQKQNICEQAMDMECTRNRNRCFQGPGRRHVPYRDCTSPFSNLARCWPRWRDPAGPDTLVGLGLGLKP